MASKIKKPVPRETRNWHAVNAHFRKAGSMGDERKEKSRKECRTWKHNRERE